MPLCTKGEYRRGIALAILFSAGLTLTLTFWGAVIATAGKFFGFREIARYISIFGGAVAYTLGLWTLSLVKFPIPSASLEVPRAIRERSEYLGAFGMGLILGNMGLCCPDPVFLTMIPFIAARGDIGSGSFLAAAYGMGRATPLIGLVILAMLGVNSLQWLARRKEAFDRFLGWSLVWIGAFMLYGYSGIYYDLPFFILLTVAPVLVYHFKARSRLLRATAWTVGTGVATFLSADLIRLVLISLP